MYECIKGFYIEGALRQFITRRGTPAELWSDQGTNFKGAQRELREAFENMVPALQQRLA